jgi:hypothetical protein
MSEEEIMGQPVQYIFRLIASPPQPLRWIAVKPGIGADLDVDILSIRVMQNETLFTYEDIPLSDLPTNLHSTAIKFLHALQMASPSGTRPATVTLDFVDNTIRHTEDVVSFQMIGVLHMEYGIAPQPIQVDEESIKSPKLLYSKSELLRLRFLQRQGSEEDDRSPESHVECALISTYADRRESAIIRKEREGKDISSHAQRQKEELLTETMSNSPLRSMVFEGGVAENPFPLMCVSPGAVAAAELFERWKKDCNCVIEELPDKAETVRDASACEAQDGILLPVAGLLPGQRGEKTKKGFYEGSKPRSKQRPKIGMRMSAKTVIIRKAEAPLEQPSEAARTIPKVQFKRFDPQRYVRAKQVRHVTLEGKVAAILSRFGEKEGMLARMKALTLDPYGEAQHLAATEPPQMPTVSKSQANTAPLAGVVTALATRKSVPPKGAITQPISNLASLTSMPSTHGVRTVDLAHYLSALDAIQPTRKVRSRSLLNTPTLRHPRPPLAAPLSVEAAVVDFLSGGTLSPHASTRSVPRWKMVQEKIIKQALGVDSKPPAPDVQRRLSATVDLPAIVPAARHYPPLASVP